MRKLTAREAGRYTARLDRIASTLEANPPELGLTKEQAMNFAFEVDQISDTIEKEAKEAFMREAAERRGTVHQADPDEPYMPSHFDQAGVLDNQQDPDEPYMALFGDTPGRPSHENRSTVFERTEALVEDLNAYSDGFKKQPSQPNVGGSPFPGPYPQKTASLGGKRYNSQTPATKGS